MTTFALVHPEHGTHFVYDTADRKRHLERGWKDRPENWKELKQEADRARKLEAVKAAQARLAAEQAELESAPEKRKPGRPRKGD